MLNFIHCWFVLPHLNLKEYNLYAIVRRTHVVSYVNYFWIENQNSKDKGVNIWKNQYRIFIMLN